MGFVLMRRWWQRSWRLFKVQDDRWTEVDRFRSPDLAMIHMDIALLERGPLVP